MPQIQQPHSGQTKRVLVRPLSAVRWSPRGSIPIRRKAASATTIPSENALLVSRWQSTQWQVDHLRFFGDLVADFAALTAAGLWKLHAITPAAGTSDADGNKLNDAASRQIGDFSR
jgi:hypothetical protein